MRREDKVEAKKLISARRDAAKSLGDSIAGVAVDGVSDVGCRVSLVDGCDTSVRVYWTGNGQVYQKKMLFSVPPEGVPISDVVTVVRLMMMEESGDVI